MAFSTKEFRGEARQGIRIHGAGSEELMLLFQKELPERLRDAGIPASCCMDVAKSGGLFGTRLPMLIIRHPNPPSQYFSIGVIVNGNTITFPLLGQSKQNTAKNMGKRYDEFKLQQEESWQSEITGLIGEITEEYTTP